MHRKAPLVVGLTLITLAAVWAGALVWYYVTTQ